MNLRDEITENGIVGAGGAGFPTDVKLDAVPEVLILNAAECEPLMHKDEEILLHQTETVISGMRRIMAAVGAKKGIVGIKAKHKEIIAKVKACLSDGISVSEIGDFYPAGDEVTLVYLTTGRVVQPGTLPLTEGCIVQNVETVRNIAAAQPVTEKFLTVAGAVRTPRTLRVPLGMRFRDILSAFEMTAPRWAVRVNGLMMGELTRDLDRPVTKTTGGLIVLPEDHHCVQMYERYREPAQTVRIARAGCDQCSFCTELCPRYLLGHPVRPETAMRNRMFSPDGEDPLHAGNLYCCECNLCTFYACPESLDPRGAAVIEKRKLAQRKTEWKGLSVKPHPLMEYRKVPVRRLMQRLDVLKFTDHAPLQEEGPDCREVRLLLKQHAGNPALPVVSSGDMVEKGGKVAEKDGPVSANIHASVSGRVTAVTKNHIDIERRG